MPVQRLRLGSEIEPDHFSVPKREEIAKMVLDEEAKRGGMWAKGRGPTAMLRRLIDLEELQYVHEHPGLSLR